MIRVGIVGCGTIGSALAKAIETRFTNFARLAYLSDLHPEKIRNLQKKLKTKFVSVSIHELIRKSDFIIEAASVKASQAVVPLVLNAGKRILVLSVGGLLKIQNFLHLMEKSKGCVYIPSGGIAGIDGVLAMKTGHIKSVEITTRKPIPGLRNSPYFIKKGFCAETIKKPTLIFHGNAADAIDLFPENVNVAVTLSLAGLGPRKTRVRIYTSPTYKNNMHEITIKGSFGTIVTQLTNLPSKENPKTSALAIGSAIATLEKIFSQIKIGT